MAHPRPTHAKNPDFTLAQARAVLEALDAIQTRPDLLEALEITRSTLNRAIQKLSEAYEAGRKGAPRRSRKRGEWTSADVAGRTGD